MITEYPRRFRCPLPAGQRHPNGSDCDYRYGAYFPLTDLLVLDMGERATGNPEGTPWFGEWLDPEEHPDG